MDEIVFPARVMSRFVETLCEEIGQDTLSAVLSNAGLPEEWAHSAQWAQDNVNSRLLLEDKMKHLEMSWKTRDGLGIFAQSWEPAILQPKAVICLVHGLGEHTSRYSHVAEAFGRQGFVCSSPIPSAAYPFWKSSFFSRFSAIHEMVAQFLGSACSTVIILDKPMKIATPLFPEAQFLKSQYSN